MSKQIGAIDNFSVCEVEGHRSESLTQSSLKWGAYSGKSDEALVTGPHRWSPAPEMLGQGVYPKPRLGSGDSKRRALSRARAVLSRNPGWRGYNEQKVMGRAGYRRGHQPYSQANLLPLEQRADP